MMGQIARLWIVLITLAAWVATAHAQKNLLESRCPDCGTDLSVSHPSHLPSCPQNEAAINARIAAIDARLKEVSKSYQDNKTTHDEYQRQWDALMRRYTDALNARSEAQRRAQNAQLEAERRMRDEDARRKRAASDAKRKADEAEAERFLDNLNQQSRIDHERHLREMDQLDREYQEAWESAFGQESTRPPQPRWPSTLSNSAVRDFGSDPLRLGDPVDTGAYIGDLRHKINSGFVAPASPLDVVHRSIIEQAPEPVRIPGSALSDLTGLGDVRDSVIDNIIARIPGELQQILERLDEQEQTNAILESLTGGTSPSQVSPRILRSLLEGTSGARHQQPAMASAQQGQGMIKRLRDLWDEPSEPKPVPPAAHSPKSLRNLLDP